MSSERDAILKLIRERSLFFGDFTLASGRKSNYYIDGKMTTLSAEGVARVGEYIFRLIDNLRPDAIGGLALGAAPIVAAVAMASYHAGRPIDAFIVRKDPKEHGTKKLIEGPLRGGSRVIIVDDVTTTGKSLLDAIKIVEEEGCNILKVVTILDRREGGGEKLRELGYDFVPILTISDLNLTPDKINAATG